MSTDYFFNVNDKYKRLIQQCIQELNELKVPIASSVYFRESVGHFRYGFCEAGRSTKYSNWDYVICLNKYMKDDHDIKNTIIHELLHTIKLSDGHKGEWKEWARYINEKTNYNITRCYDLNLKEDAYANLMTVTCPVCRNSISVRKTSYITTFGALEYICGKCRMYFYKAVPDTPIKNYSESEKDVFIENMFKDSAAFDNDAILKALPYLSQTQRNTLILKMLKEKPELFLSFKERWCFTKYIYGVCDSKTRAALANMYINNEVERLNNMSYSEYIEFSNLFALTKEYIQIEQHWLATGHKTV